MDIQNPVRLGRRHAFTLVEMMTTLSVACLLLTLSIPGYRLLTNSRIVTTVNGLAAHLHLARSEAIKRGIQVILCPSSDGKTCLNSLEWQNGFMIYGDSNQNREPDQHEETLRYYQPDSTRIKITTSIGRKKLVYKPSGMSPGSTATITVCDKTRQSPPRAIIVSNTGRPRLAKTGADGKPLDCG
ncbi:MAG: prepilin-type N-terminal cleavage/methylation domain-containing protein [Gammaproteobacteria bacterium]|nr:prepilin-type N-terminal cleavage/methylation domain-containing protein [Gammaproteobacteria bacterium]